MLVVCESETLIKEKLEVRKRKRRKIKIKKKKGESRRGVLQSEKT